VSTYIGGSVYNQRLVIKCHLLKRGWLKYFKPLRQSFAINRWIFHAATLNPFEKDIRQRAEIVQLNGRAKRSGSEPQGISLGSSPRSPFDDYSKAKREELLREFPLERFDLPSPLFVVVVKGKSVHPFVGGKTDGAKPAFKRPAEGGFARTRQSAQDD
jgi:hypothetical protein